MANLLAAAAFFVLLHLLVSGTRLRDVIIGKIGQGPYMGLFVLASFAGLGWLGWSFSVARTEVWNIAYWTITPLTRHIQLGVQLLAMLLIVPGLFTKNPTAVRGEGSLDDPNLIKGMLRISRHPFLWGVSVWAAGHLLVNGERASIVLFASMLLLGVYGTASIDAKRKRALGPAWDAFASQTSNAPFGAILSGRQTFSLGEIGWWRIALAVGVWLALMFGHPYLFGVAARA